MSDIAKWGLLVAAAVAVVALIFSIMGGFGWDVDQALSIFAYLIESLVELAENAFRFGREMINLLFVLPGLEPIMTGLLVYLFTRWFVQLGIKITAWIYHYIFK